MINLADRLESTMDVYRPFASSACLAFAEGANRRELIDYLVRLHQVIRASVPMMQEAIKRLSENKEHERVQEYLAEHCDEEAEHDVWLENDITKIDPAANLHSSPHFTASRLVGEAEYLIRYVTPVSVLGYIAAVECNQPSLSFIDTISRKLGGADLYCLKEHSELDIEHAREFMDFVRSESFDDAEQDAILHSAKRTMINAIEFMSVATEKDIAA